MDDSSEQQRKDNHSRFDDLCNSDLVDQAASLAAAAMMAADKQKETEQKQQNIFILSSQQDNAAAKVAEAIDEVYFPSRAEREEFGNRVRRSPAYYAPSIVTLHQEHPDDVEMEKRPELTTEVEEEVEVGKRPDLVINQEPVAQCSLSEKDLTELKEKAISQDQWDSGSVYEDEQQQAKVCFLIKIEELNEEGIPMYKAVNIDSDLSAIKLCHSFMNERANRRDLMKRGKGAAKFTADIFCKVADFLQKNEGDNDSSDWRTYFKSNVDSGLHDSTIRRLVNKYETFHPPPELAVLELIWESKSKHDDQRKKHEKIKQEEALKGHEQTLSGFENYLGSLNIQGQDSDQE